MKAEKSMKTEPQNHKTSIPWLIRGIIQDAVTLINKELTAARLEIREELDKAKSAGLLMGFGGSAVAIGTILLCFMAAHLIQSLTGLQLWVCYAIVGIVLILLGVMFFFFAKRRAAGTSLVPARSVANAKEDARWITHRVK